MTKKNRDSDVAFIQALAELLREHDLTEVEVMRAFGSDDSLNVRVSRSAPAAAPIAISAPTAPAPPAMAASPAPAADATSTDPAALPGAVTSPMVGTVYLAPEPGADVFVTVGDSVAEGDTLLIIEAMKTMNQIPAPHGGTVKRILIEDGAPVEFGAPLMIVE